MKIEAVTFKCQGNELFGELYIPDETPAPGIIVCHGMNKYGFHAIELYRKFAEASSENGFVTLLFDFRGCGESAGKFGYGIAEQKDLKCALNYLSSRREVDIKKIFIVGHSLGGTIALHTVRNEEIVRGLVLWSTPANHAYNVRKFIVNNSGKLGYYLFLLVSYMDSLIDISKLFNMRVYGILLRPSYVRKMLMKLDECEVVSKLRIPILIVAGDKDRIVGVEETRQVFSAANNPKKFVIINGANHIFERKENEVISETLNWLRTLI